MIRSSITIAIALWVEQEKGKGDGKERKIKRKLQKEQSLHDTKWQRNFSIMRLHRKKKCDKEDGMLVYIAKFRVI